MDIEEMRKHEWSISWSGGKDSTATIILAHECGVPIKEIVYVRMMYDETIPATLPIMTDFVDRAAGVFRSWGYPVRIVPSIMTAKDIINKTYQRSKYKDRNGNKYGITAFMRGFCLFTSVKQQTVNRLILSDYQLIGYAFDETERLGRLNDRKCSIMQTLEVTEADTFNICREYNLLSPLYELNLSRDGCWFCPNAGKKERELIKSEYPELYHKITDMCDMCNYDISEIAKKGRNTWLSDYYKNK